MNRKAETSKKWIVKAGNLQWCYYTEYHAEQMARAHRLNGMSVSVTSEETCPAI